MTLDQLRYFVEASKFEHVGKAARSIHISPGAVSTAILALERELGCPLFRRHKNRIYLNAEGKYLRDQAQSVIEQLEHARLRLRSGRVELEGSYRIGASHFLAARLLAPAWAELAREQPKASVELCSMPTVGVVSEVLRGTLDLGLCFSPLAHPDLSQSVLRQGTLVLAVGRGHPFARRSARFALSDLSSFPAVIHKSAPGVDICETHPNFERYGIRPSIAVQFDGDDLAVETLKRSKGWSLLPDWVVRSTPGLAAVPLPRGWTAPYTIALVCRRSREDRPVARLLMEKLRRLVESDSSNEN